MVSSMGVTGNSTVVANVWHRSGGDTLVQSAAAGTMASAAPADASDDTDSQAPEGVLGLTGQLVALLGSNYDLAYTGTSSADNRPALMVEAVREDGSLAARFWLDSATKLPLRREVFDAQAHLVGEDVFINLAVGSTVAEPTATSAAAQQLTAVDVTQMRARGWPVPGQLPGRLTLFEAGQTSTSSGTVLDLGYSDGLFAVSIFVQRGNLAPKLAGVPEDHPGRPGRLCGPARPPQRHLGRAGLRVHGHGRCPVGHPGPGRRRAALRRAARVLGPAVQRVHPAGPGWRTRLVDEPLATPPVTGRVCLCPSGPETV